MEKCLYGNEGDNERQYIILEPYSYLVLKN
jgi:hypothetical protein